MVIEDRLRRLAAAQTKDQLVDALWDLRDSAFDAPAAWSALTVEVLAQGLAQALEQAPVEEGGQVSAEAVVQALASAIRYAGHVGSGRLGPDV